MLANLVVLEDDSGETSSGVTCPVQDNRQAEVPGADVFKAKSQVVVYTGLHI